jgi:hypothetical protein
MKPALPRRYSLLRASVWLVCLCALGCASDNDAKAAKSAKREDAGADTLQPPQNPTITFDAGRDHDMDGSTAPDAFFINDPAPPMCGPNGEVSSAKPTGGSADCPNDKNREGCPCDKPGQTSSCWPGKRVNRNHGVCKDGMTTCRSVVEFESTWGPCEGYILPEDGAVQGAPACRCFSNGRWALNNLVPCIYRDDEKDEVHITSSRPDADKGFRCEAKASPTADWTESTLNVECAGQFRLCYTLKAGDVESPKSKDCTLVQKCIDSWYPKPNEDQRLPNLGGWASEDEACAKRFVDVGGYGEMSVVGMSSECDAVDDGNGKPFVFMRTRYCSSRCSSTPDLPECKACGTGGSGQF